MVNILKQVFRIRIRIIRNFISARIHIRICTRHADPDPERITEQKQRGKQSLVRRIKSTVRASRFMH
jgi:hypothetical protein